VRCIFDCDLVAALFHFLPCKPTPFFLIIPAAAVRFFVHHVFYISAGHRTAPPAACCASFSFFHNYPQSSPFLPPLRISPSPFPFVFLIFFCEGVFFGFIEEELNQRSAHPLLCSVPFGPSFSALPKVVPFPLFLRLGCAFPFD